VVHADETPVPVLELRKTKIHRGYIWAYCTTPYADTKAVVYDFAPTRAGEHAWRFLEGWQGKLICDDYSGLQSLLWPSYYRDRLYGAFTAQVL